MSGQPLARIRADLDLVRAHLMHPSSKESCTQMVGHLESAVRGLEDWVRQLPSSQSDRKTDLRAVTDLEAQLRQVEPLFENARKLQAGWSQFLNPDEDAAGYDGSGVLTRIAGGQRTAKIEEAG